MSGGHGHGVGHGDDHGSNKKIAILISVLALCLAIAETLAKGAQTNSISYNVEASNLWAFYQAKTIRQTTLKTAAEQMQVDVALARDPAVKERLEKRVSDWKAEVERYQSEPKTGSKGENQGEGRRELQARAIEAQKKRDLYMEKYHQYEISSAAFQIAIVLASAYLITGAMSLLWMSLLLGAVGIAFGFIGYFVPGLVHLF
jgi:hypothetical protein